MSTKPKPLPSSKLGSKPGERRGGRGPGTKNKAVVDRERMLAEAVAIAVATIGDRIWAMSMVDIMEFAARLAFENGWVFKAAEIARDAAPYKSARLASTTVDDRRRRSPEEFDEQELLALASADLGIDGVAEEVHRPN